MENSYTTTLNSVNSANNVLGNIANTISSPELEAAVNECLGMAWGSTHPTLPAHQSQYLHNRPVHVNHHMSTFTDTTLNSMPSTSSTMDSVPAATSSSGATSNSTSLGASMDAVDLPLPEFLRGVDSAIVKVLQGIYSNKKMKVNLFNK